MSRTVLGIDETVTKTNKNVCPNSTYIMGGRGIIGKTRRRRGQAIKQIVKNTVHPNVINTKNKAEKENRKCCFSGFSNNPYLFASKI